MVEYDGYTAQQFEVDVGPTINVVDILPAAIELSGKPSDGT